MTKKFLIKRLIKQVNWFNIKRTFSFAKKHGMSEATKRVIHKFQFVLRGGETDEINKKRYQRWIKKHEPSSRELVKQKKHTFPNTPTVSVVVPSFNAPVSFLEEMIDSVLGQTYSNWELCIADGSSKKDVLRYLKKVQAKDSRIKLRFLEHNYGIVGNTNQAISLAAGDYVAFLDHDDTLAPFTLHEVVKTINKNPGVDFIYSDEDKLSFDGKIRANPHLKPDHSPDNLLSYNYITHLLVLKSSLLKKVNNIRSGFEGAQDFDLVLRASEVADKIVHIPKILYHWREHNNSTSTNSGSKSYVMFSTHRAVADALRRRKLQGRIINGSFFGSVRTLYAIEGKPKISIIIPNTDSAKTLKTCIDSIINRSSYSNYEIIIVDSNSKEQSIKDYYKELSQNDDVKITYWKKSFNFSAVNNYAAKSANGDYLIFLNNDTEIITADWIEAMLEYCQRKDVGAVGAKLLYPDHSIQHAGIIIGIGQMAGHSHKSFGRDSGGHYGRLFVPNNLSAVTAACVMISTKVFKEVGGFEEEYPLALSDVDICLKIRQKNYLVVWTPYAELIHYESKTRGYEDTPEKQKRFKGEVRIFRRKWGNVLNEGDPYYNPNLTLDREDFTLRDN